MRYVPRPLALCAICFLLLPTAAHAQADAQVDPNSPAGVEYQLPLEQARENLKPSDGEGPGSEGGRGEGVASLFGAGIVPVKDGTGAQGDGGRGAAGSGSASEPGASGSDPSGGARGGADTGSGAPDIKASGLGSSDDDDGGSATLRLGGIVLAVLLVGALLGLALRRGLRQSAE